MKLLPAILLLLPLCALSQGVNSIHRLSDANTAGTGGVTNYAGHAGETNSTRRAVFRERVNGTNLFSTLEVGPNLGIEDQGTNLYLTVTGGAGDVTTSQLLVVSNLFRTDISNLQGATNGLDARAASLENATNQIGLRVTALELLPGGGGTTSTTLTVRATANIVNNTTGFVDATNLTFSVAALTNYRFRFVVHYTSAATSTGARFGINWPAANTALRVGGVLPTGQTTAVNSGTQSAYDTAIYASTIGPGATGVMGTIEGVFRNGINAGTPPLRVASEVGTSAVTILADSHGELTQF